INGQGGNVISLINVSETDGSGMDNAFWSGTAMFYGNGNQAFSAPLCKSLDVGGHEMTHGVIGSTANLIYEAQSGALNESFADVFGVMIDPANWLLGEDVVNTAIFTSGALRDMSNPHNGGSGPNDPGWQPAHMSEYQNLPVNAQNDNGGVHVNSGIPNKAFYLFATSVGNSKAEQVYYRALTQYLTASSQFIDCRLAVIQAAEDLYGAGSSEANAAASAFDQVGITGGGGGSSGPGDLQTNPGADYILLTDLSDVGIYLYDGQNFPQLSTTSILSRPSVTDDGSAIVFVAADQTLRALILNQNTGLYEEYYLENNPQTIWRNIAVSKDGSKIAALTTDYDNSIFVYDYNTSQGQTFTLYTPTSGGTITYDVQYADVLEWDYSGEYIMYDAYNVLAGGIDYWDISFIRVWDKSSNSFGDGFINKLFNALPENSSVGNPAFSKNSPYIISLDFLDQSFGTEYYLLGVNLETGDVGTILQNNTLGYPNYSIDDGALIFDRYGADLQISIIDLNADKITASGTPQDFVYGGHWGVWFGTGSRPLVHVKEVFPVRDELGLSPNPARTELQVSWPALEQRQQVDCLLYDMAGKEVLHTSLMLGGGAEPAQLSLPPLCKGQYELLLKTPERMAGAHLQIQ
ncbi:MAG TPA: metalloprotease, partial [Phaeodactylibacter sp.]|nr:metalloprotease [Phaeodactylibacter sp.]